MTLSNGMSNIIQGYIDHRKLATFMAFSFIIFLHVLLGFFFNHCVYGGNVRSFYRAGYLKATAR